MKGGTQIRRPANVLLWCAIIAAGWAASGFFLFEDAGAADPNAFNRLMQPPAKRNPPPPQDGIHDPAVPPCRPCRPLVTLLVLWSMANRVTMWTG